MPVRLKCQKWANFLGVDFLGTALKFRERKICRRLFTSSIKREIRHFHVVFFVEAAEKCTKKRDARESLLFCLISLLFF